MQTKKTTSFKYDLSPEKIFGDLKTKYFGYKEDSPKAILLTTIVCTFLCYFYHMVNGLGCPDTLTEGIYTYKSYDYTTSLARWMIRYLNELFGKNIVVPALIVLFYCLMIGASTYIICRMTKITEPFYRIMLTAMMVSFPVVLHQFAYMCAALAYSFSFLTVVIGTLLIRTRKILGIIAGTLFYLLMLGSYQSYIGAISSLAVILLIYDALYEKKIATGLIRFALCGGCGLLACIIDMPFSSWMMRIHGIEESTRVSDFRITYIFENLGFSIRYSYIWFFSYFNNDVLSRNRLYFVVFAIIAVLAVLTLIKLIKEHAYVNAVIVLVSLLLLPAAMNLVLYVFTAYGLHDILRYQYVLIFLLLFILHKYLGKNILNSLTKYLSVLAVLLLLIGNIISANCTAYMYKIYYDHYEQQYLLAMARVYELDGYTANITKIVTGGAPSCEVYHIANPKIFRYSEQEGGPVFWNDPFGMTAGRQYYFQDFLGINPGILNNQEYHDIIHSEEYAQMPVWPAEGSVKMINGYAVIKFTDYPPSYY